MKAFSILPLRSLFVAAILVALATVLSRCAPEPSSRPGVGASPKPTTESASKEKSGSDSGRVLETKTGLASFYGTKLEGEETSSGEILDKEEMVAAHPSYPEGTRVRVTNLEKDKSVKVRIIDRGPNKANRAEGVIIDLSQGAAREIGLTKKDGRTQVRVEVLEWGDERPSKKDERSDAKKK